jgi:vacuolar protein sorting-associated protein 26
VSCLLRKLFQINKHSILHERICLQDGEDVRGQVLINLNKGKKLDHLGIRVELVGIIENLYDKNQNSIFLQLVRDLEPPGALTDNMTYEFKFNRVEK